jgi:hypothetical protein
MGFDNNDDIDDDKDHNK